LLRKLVRPFSRLLPQVPDVVGRGKEQYRKRKKASVDRCVTPLLRKLARPFSRLTRRCRMFLDEDPNKHWREHFIASAKKDDLADTVMQALSYIERRGGSSAAASASAVSAPVKPKKITARQPTENQKATRFSQSNLLWLLNNTPEDQLLRDKRFLKDMRRYYASFEEFKTRVRQ
jgi:hypothetical protein